MCDLCELKGCKYKLVTCNTCNIPMIVSVDHKPSFSEEEKKEIKRMFPRMKIRWNQRKIKDHAHCHLYKGD